MTAFCQAKAVNKYLLLRLEEQTWPEMDDGVRSCSWFAMHVKDNCNLLIINIRWQGNGQNQAGS